MTQTYDGATTALRRWSKRWKALAKRYRCSNAYYHDKADEFESRIDTAMVAIRQRPTRARIWKALAKKLRWQLTWSDERIGKLVDTIALQDAVLRAANEREAAARAAREQAENSKRLADEQIERLLEQLAIQGKARQAAEADIDSKGECVVTRAKPALGFPDQK